MQRDADGDLFFGFCGVRVYVPDEDPNAEGLAEGLLRRFRERLAAELAKEEMAARNKTANVRSGGAEGRLD